MSININSLPNIQPISNGINSTQKTSGNKTSFADVINDALNKVNDLQVQSSNMTDDFLTGKSDNIHSVMIAGSKSDLALQMTLQVRNKVMDAYKEIMNMQV